MCSRKIQELFCEKKENKIKKDLYGDVLLLILFLVRMFFFILSYVVIIALLICISFLVLLYNNLWNILFNS